MSSLSDETRWMDATEQAALVASGEVSALELVDAAIERIEAGDGPLNAVVVPWFDEARADAQAPPPADAPFAGVPILIKDLNAHVAGRVLTNGNAALRDAQPVSTFDSTIVERFRAAGTIMVGRTASSEIGSLPVTETAAYGPTRNPWDTGRTPGGSSGGAAAAVATGMVPVAHASDGGGSIRIPASCCGLVGLKPSQGRISMGPDRQETGLGIDFVVARSVRDTAAFLDAASGPGVGDDMIAPPPQRPFAQEPGSDPGALRIGLLDQRPNGEPVHPDCAAAVRAAGALLESLGHHVTPDQPAALHDPAIMAHFTVLWAVSRAAGIARYGDTIGRPLGPDEVEPANWAMAQLADSATASAYADALAATGRLRRSMQQWWADGNDLLLTPTLAEPPLEIGRLDAPADQALLTMIGAGEWTAFTPQFNTTGQPGISLPLFWNDDGLPVGVQLVAAYGREDLLLSVAAQLEAAQPWADRHPTI